jgi:hypothetical protein
MKLGRGASVFLLAFGVWSWFIWITFARNLFRDASGLAFDAAGDPTGYFWVHLALAVTSFGLGTAVGAIGLRGLLTNRRWAATNPEGIVRLVGDSPRSRESDGTLSPVRTGKRLIP